MSEITEDTSRWPNVVEAGSLFGERLGPLFQGRLPTLDALFEALVSYYAEVPVEAFSRDEQHLIVEWGTSEGMDWFALRRGFYDDGRCCDVFLEAYFAIGTSIAASDPGNRVCCEVEALPHYSSEIRSLPTFRRNAHSVPARLSLCAASAYGDGHEYPEIRITA